MLNAQKEDYIWLAGYESVSGYDTNSHHWFGISKFDFNQQPVTLSRDSLNIWFFRSNSTISDNVGQNILFYSNGNEIRNSLDEIIENGDSLGCIDGSWFTKTYGIPGLYQYHIVLPNPLNTSQYDFFHCFVDSFNQSNGQFIGGKKLLHTRVDVSLNNFHGGIIKKNELVLSEENCVAVSAVRHGNGRDWWLCTNKTSSNCYTTILFNGTDSIKRITSCGGSNSARGYGVPERFSPDGNYFVSSTTNNGSINIFNFDRCNGELDLRESFIIPELRDSFVHWWANSIEFSPNNRYLYIISIKRIYQYDLWESNIESSKRIIANYNDTFGCPFGHSYFQAQLAPDGKIYINSGNGGYCVSVIDHPDEESDSCHFILNYELPTFINGLPYYPNYRLGALAGSACDTITTLTPTLSQRERELKVFPNPATDIVTIDYGYTNWEKGDVDLEIANAAGQLIYTQHLPMYSGFQRLDVTQYARGAYNVVIKRGNTIVATSQFVKQ